MGNVVGNWFAGSTIVPSEEGKGGGEADGTGVTNGDGFPPKIVAESGDGGGEGAVQAARNGRLEFRSEMELARDPPTTIMEVLLNTVYAMEFHKYLAMTNCSENYEFVQAVCHFTHDTANNQQTIRGEGNKIYSLYVAEAAPLRVALSEDVRAKITEAIEAGEVSRQIFDEARKDAVSLMERESLHGFFSSTLVSELQRRIGAGEMETLIHEDIFNAREIVSKEFIKFLGDPDLKKVLSSQMGVYWFRKHLELEFAEEGLDLWQAVRDMLLQDTLSRGQGDNIAVPASETATLEVDGGREVEEKSRDRMEENFDIRKAGRDLQARFIDSGCGAECNLPWPVVRKVMWLTGYQVAKALDDPESNPEAVRKVFELIEVEIFKLLAYDPFLRFKRSGLFTKYCMKAQMKAQRSSLSVVAAERGDVTDAGQAPPKGPTPNDQSRNGQADSVVHGSYSRIPEEGLIGGERTREQSTEQLDQSPAPSPLS